MRTAVMVRLVVSAGCAAIAAASVSAAAVSSVGDLTQRTASTTARRVADTHIAVSTIHPSRGQPAEGTRVALSRTERRVFINAQDGVAIASVHDEAVPARTTDGGRVWKIDGPGLFAEEVADAAGIAETFDALDPSEFYAYGGGNVIYITTDAGRVWRRVLFQGLEVSVAPVAKGLAAYVDPDTRSGRTLQYYTTNGGRSWRVVNGLNF